MLTPNIYVKFEREKYLTLLQIQTSNHRRIEITLKKNLGRSELVYRPKQPLNQKHFTQENGQLKIDELPENNVWENLKDTLSKLQGRLILTDVSVCLA